MSKKEKSIQSVYQFLKTIISYFTTVFCLAGFWYLYYINFPTKVENLCKNDMIAIFNVVYICIVFCEILLFFGLRKNENILKKSIFLTVVHIFNFYVIFPSKNSLETMSFLVLISVFLCVLIEKIVINKKYNIACIGYKDILIQKEEVKIYPLYSEFIWRIFLSHLEQCPEENKKIMLQDIKTFADRIYKLHTEDLELLGIVDDEHSYVKQVEIYFDRKNQKLVKYYQYDYENYESKKGLEKLILWLNKKRSGNSNMNDK